MNAHVRKRDLMTSTRVYGAGGGKGAGSASSTAASEAPNTLQSKNVIKLLELLGEGPIQGVVGGAKGVVLNSGGVDATPLQNQDGSWNVKGVTFEQRLGLPTQTPIQGFDDQVQTSAVNVEVKNQGDPTANAVVRRITNVSDACRVVLQVDALNASDLKTGAVNGYSVEWAIDVKSSADAGGSYVELVHDRIAGKTTSPWQKAYRIPLTGSAPWDIRVRRISADDADSSTRSVTRWAFLSEIDEYKLGYPHSAIVGVTADSEQFGTSVPKRGYEVEGLIVKVPSNYNPLTRTYTGIWNGTFTTAYTNNPAWVLYDLLTNNRYGLGDVFTSVRVALGKWDLYAAGKYCDEMVDNGQGGMEPRFTFNACISNRMKAYQALTAICGMFRTQMMWSGGQLRFMQDRPADSQKIFGPANVVDGLFNYTGTALRARHTAVRVTWQNPEKGYQADDILLEDPDGIVRYGYNLKEETAYGCTSYGQAMRHARNILVTEAVETDSVQFRCGQGEADVLPGQIFVVSDPSMTQADWAGRLVSVAGTQVTFDRAIAFDPARTYTLSVVTKAGVVVDRALSNPGVSAMTAYIGSALTGDDEPVPDAMYAISSDVLEPRPFRLVGISEDGPAYKLLGLLHSPEKYEAIETGLRIKPGTTYGDLPSSSTVEPPTGLTLEYRTVGDARGSNGVLDIDWEPSDDYYLAGYIVEYQIGFDNWIRMERTSDTSATLEDPRIDVVRVRVYAVNKFGRMSLPATSSINLATGTGEGKDLIYDLEVVGGGNEWTGKDLFIHWKANPIYGSGSQQEDGKDPFFRRFRIRVYNAAGTTLLRTYTTPNFEWTLPYEQMVEMGLSRTYVIKISIEDIAGAFSEEFDETFSNPPPELVTVTPVVQDDTITFKFTDPTDPDYAGMVVYMTSLPVVTTTPDMLAYKGGGHPTLAVNPLTTYKLKWGFYDAFGEVGITYSATFTLTTPDTQIGELTATALVEAIGDAEEMLDRMEVVLGEVMDSAGDIRDFVEDLIDENSDAEALMQEIVDQANRHEALRKLGYSKEGRPNGAYIEEQRIVTDDHVETLSIMGVKTGDRTAFILNGSNVKVSPTETLAQRFERVQVESGEDAAAMVDVERLARITAVSAEAGLRTTLAANFSNYQTVNDLAVSNVATATSGLAQEVHTLGAWNGAHTVFIVDTTKAYVSPTESFATKFSNLDVTNASGTSGAHFANQINARITAEGVIASELHLLGAKNAGNTAFVLDTNTTQVSPGLTLASKFSQLDVTNSGGTAGSFIQNALNARITAEGIIADELHVLGAWNGSHTAFVIDTSKAIVDGGQTMATRFSGISAKADTAYSAVGTESAVRATVEGVLAYQNSAVTGTFGALKSTVAINASVVDGIKANYVIALDSNGKIAGVKLLNDGSVSSAAWLFDKFTISTSDGGIIRTPFSVSGSTVRMTNIEVDTIKASTVYAGHIVSDGITYIDGDSASGTQYGTNGDQLIFEKWIWLEYDAKIIVLGQVNYFDGGGHSASSHSARVKIYVDGVGLVAQNGQDGAFATTSFTALGKCTLGGGQALHVTMYANCRDFDYYTDRSLVVMRAYR